MVSGLQTAPDSPTGMAHRTVTGVAGSANVRDAAGLAALSRASGALVTYQAPALASASQLAARHAAAPHLRSKIREAERAFISQLHKITDYLHYRAQDVLEAVLLIQSICTQAFDRCQRASQGNAGPDVVRALSL